MMELSCKSFVEVLASSKPVPGGGGAAALCGAIGTALGHMVGALTVGKKKYKDVEEQIRNMMERCTCLEQELLDLVEEDAKAFAPLARAYSLPAETEEEKNRKAQILEQCSKDACEVPLKIMQACCEGIDLAETFSLIGSRLAISDAGCAAAILKGALEAASLNIFINTKTLEDRSFACEINKKAQELLDIYTEKAGHVFRTVQLSLMGQ